MHYVAEGMFVHTQIVERLFQCVGIHPVEFMLLNFFGQPVEDKNYVYDNKLRNENPERWEDLDNRKNNFRALDVICQQAGQH